MSIANNYKMNWFVDKYFNNELNYTIYNTGKKKGTVVVPTGGGKSGMIYEDIVKHIKLSSPNEKYIFNISAPILKLEVQLLNDFFSVLKFIFEDRIKNNEFMFFINSSDDGNNYNVPDIDVNDFKDIDTFLNSESARFAIVASCHKSLYKFADKVKHLNNFATTFSYLDEAHLVVNVGMSADISYEKCSNKKKESWEYLRKLFNCNYVYAVTATPDQFVTEELNNVAGEKYDYKLINVPARELIEKNIIVSVKTYTIQAEKITAPICIKFMNDVKYDNPYIKHKILVNCANTKHLIELQEILVNNGYKVFSTCSKHGAMEGIDDDLVIMNPNEFINMVDNYNDDCFVLHIKQLIQGIDIKTLTDCIYCNNTTTNYCNERRIIQTVGRCIRTLENERGVYVDMRKKKYANVLFVNAYEDYDNSSEWIVAFLINYYGRDGLKAFKADIHKNYGDYSDGKDVFGNGNSHFADDFVDYGEIIFNELKCNLENYIKNVIEPRHKNILKMIGANNKLIEKSYNDVMNYIKKEFNNGDYNTYEILSNTTITKMISDLFNKYNVK